MMAKGCGKGFVSVGSVVVGRAGQVAEAVANEVIHHVLPGAPKVTETAVGRPTKPVDRGGPRSAPITGPGCVESGGCRE
jgi:hypothetical protein